MRCIAIRVSPSEIFYAIGEADRDDSYEYSLESIIVPKILEIPDRLSYVRNVLQSIVTEQKITYAGLRLSEGNAQSQSIDRIYLEGVIQEFFSNSSIEVYQTFRIPSLAAKINKKSSEVKQWIKDGKMLDEYFDEWSTLKVEKREALLILHVLMGGDFGE